MSTATPARAGTAPVLSPARRRCLLAGALLVSVAVALAGLGGLARRRAAEADFRRELARAQEFQERGNFSGAVAALEAAHSARPDAFDVLMDLNRAAQLANGGFTPARVIRLLEEYVERHPHDARGRLELGIISTEAYSAIGYDRAERHLRRLVEMRPGDADALNWLGVALLRAGKFREALGPLQRALAIDPNRPQTGYWVACCHERLGDYDRAIAAARPLIDLEPLPTVRLFLHRVQQKAGRRPDPGHAYRERGAPPWPASPVRFDDVAATAGLRVDLNGRGSGWADYDGDGFLDLAVASSLRPLALWRNRGDGTFVDEAHRAGLASSPPGWCTLWADYDGDGDPDLFVGRSGWAGPERNSLFRNRGDGTFVDVAAEAGVDDPDRACFTASWADYDCDGDLDLYTTSFYGAPNRLFRNDGTGRFQDVAPSAGVAGRESSIGCAWGDYDDDGDPDLYVVNLAADNTLYRNDGDGTFTDVTREAGVAMPFSSYAAFWLDYDNDGRLDLFVSGFAGFYQHAEWLEDPLKIDRRRSNRLYRNLGNGRFQNVTVDAGLDGNFGAMAASLGDVDNDGFEDIYLGCGGPDLGRLEESLLFRNDGRGRFRNVSRAAGVGYVGKVHGVTFADFDNDGWLDIYLPAGAVHAGDAWPAALYRNRRGAAHWSVLRLRGRGANREAIGAQVCVKAGKHTVYRTVDGGCGFGVTNQRALQIGLGEETKIDRVRVRWPDGAEQEWRDLAVDAAHELQQGENVPRPWRRPRNPRAPTTSGEIKP